MAHSLPFSNLTNSYFLISPTEYAKNLLNEEWGCFKHIGMPWDMIMKLPIQDRRAFIHKHNREQDEINRDIDRSEGKDMQSVQGEAINAYAKIEQSNLKNR